MGESMTVARRALRDALTISFGFHVPESCAHLIELSEHIDLGEAFGTELSLSKDDWTSPRWRGHAILYHTWQPEFFEFLGPGEDGIGQGFVVHAPELDQDEWPVFEHDPSGFNGDMVFLGSTLTEALEMLVAHDRVYSGREMDLAANASYAALAPSLGLSLHRKTLVRRTRLEECYVPYTPSGWRFEQCGDMIGALAPIESFAETQLRLGVFLERYDNDRTAARAAMTDEARALLKRGFAGSALLGIRRLYRAVALSDVGDQCELLELWADAYAVLRRPLLERVVRERLSEQRRLSEQNRSTYTLELHFEIPNEGATDDKA
jgi:hypothetical protein